MDGLIIGKKKSKDEEELIRKALHHSDYFTCLDEEQVQRFVEAATLRRYEPGEVVILEGCIDDDTKDYEQKKQDTTFLLRRIISFRQKQTEETGMAAAELGPVPGRLRETEEIAADSGASPERLQQTSEAPDVNDEQEDEFLKEGESYASLVSLEQVHEEVPEPSSSPMLARQEEQKENSEEETEGEMLPVSSGQQSGITSYVYAVQSGRADVLYDNAVKLASLGSCSMFGEGGFLFHRQHSATVLASSPLEVWVVSAKTFRDYVLPSENMRRMFAKYASTVDNEGNPCMSMDDFIQSCSDRESMDVTDPTVRVRMANTYHILRKTKEIQKITLANFCLFHLLMARPDPEVDIAFLLMDQDRTGTISLDNLKQFLGERSFDFGSDFVRRHFGKGGSVLPHHFSQFFADFQRELGRQAFLREVEDVGSPEGFLNPKDFVRVLRTSCGWRLPEGAADRLEYLYCKAPIEAAEAAAIMSVQAEKLKGSSNPESAKATTATILASLEKRSYELGDRCFAYGDFLAFQEVLQQLPGICNLIQGACAIKKGPISPDDFKVANRVIGLGGKLSRRQVKIVFQLFDLDNDGFIAAEDMASVVGVDFVYKLEATTGREGKLTFAPPPDFLQPLLEETDGEDTEEVSLSGYIKDYAREFGLGLSGGTAGAIVGVLLSPLGLVKTRMQLQRIRSDGVRMYKNTLDCFLRAYRGGGLPALYRGSLPFLLGALPQRAFQLTIYKKTCSAYEIWDEGAGSYTAPPLIQALSGACGGACQVLFATPLDRAQIELQIQGETSRMLLSRGKAPRRPQSFWSIAADIGVTGFYKGAASCLLRDILFSALFFPTYETAKSLIKANLPESELSSPRNAFLAGFGAAIPSAAITTPADVIKTRLQAPSRPGDIAYFGLSDCAAKTLKYEGFRAFFKGVGLRTLRVALTLGATMSAYETLPSMFDFRPETKKAAPRPDARDFRTAYPTRAIGTKAEDIDGLLQNMGVNLSKPIDVEARKKR